MLICISVRKRERIFILNIFVLKATKLQFRFFLRTLKIDYLTLTI